MSTWIEPPPPQKGMGCFAKGCLTFLAFIILLLLALTFRNLCGLSLSSHGDYPEADHGSGRVIGRSTIAATALG